MAFFGRVNTVGLRSGMQLIGLDVGFSARKRTSGLAVLCDGEVLVGRASSEAASRLALLGEVTAAAVTAIDAPVLRQYSYFFKLLSISDCDTRGDPERSKELLP